MGLIYISSLIYSIFMLLTLVLSGLANTVPAIVKHHLLMVQ